MQYLGSGPSGCVNNFDQISYVQAVSSNVFNAVTTDVFNILIKIFQFLNPNAGTGSLSAHIPNAFKGVLPGTYIDTKEDVLALTDGGADGQEIPFQPLLVTARGVDVIIALDMVSIWSLFEMAFRSVPLDSLHRVQMASLQEVACS